MTSIRSTSLALWISVFALGYSGPGFAQNWEMEPIVKVGGEYEDNSTLEGRTDEEVSLSGALMDLRADFKYSSDRTSFLFQPNALIRRYDESEYDNEDFFVRSDINYRAQWGKLGLRVFYEDQSIRTAERATSDLDVEDPGDITDDDTGAVDRFGDRTKWRLSPKWEYQFSSISTVDVGIDYYDVEYDEDIADLFDDYTDTRVNLNYRRKFSNVNTGLLTLTGRQFDSDNNSSNSDGYGIMAGFEYALSPKMSLKALAGIENTDQSGIDYDPEFIANVVLTRDLETIKMFAQYRRTVNASGSGRLSTRDSINLKFRRRLSEKVSAGVGVRAYQSSGVEGGISLEDRDYVQLQSSFQWYLSTAMVIEADYRYTVSDRSGGVVDEQANSNQVNLWFVYQPRTTPRL